MRHETTRDERHLQTKEMQRRRARLKELVIQKRDSLLDRSRATQTVSKDIKTAVYAYLSR